METENKFQEEFDKKWEEYRTRNAERRYPNIMLLGVTGAGKSSLINDIFGEYAATVSDTAPETQGFDIYMGRDYGRTVNLIDSAGYELGNGDTYYGEIKSVVDDGVEGEPVHIIWYCIPIPGNRVQQVDVDTLKNLLSEEKIRKRLCIVFTKCDLDTEDDEIANALSEVIRSEVSTEIKIFKTSQESDLTLDMDELIKWSADSIDDEDLRRDFIGSQIRDLRLKSKSADKIIAAAAVAAFGVGAAPIPFSDAAILVPIQVGMAAKIIDVYGVGSLASISSAVIGDVIVSNLGKSLAGNLAKMIPGIGSIVGGAINAAVASAITYAIGAAVSKICYENVKSYMEGKDVDWIHIFDAVEFKNLASKFLKKEMANAEQEA